MDIETLSKILRENGVVGAGGAGFPTYGKLSDKADTIILNCAECEPLLKLHRQLLLLKCREILKAFSIVKETLNAKNAIIGIKAEYAETVDAIEAILPEFKGITVKKLKSSYPAGDEVVLIYETTGRVVRPGGIPIEQGVAVFNVETMYNTYRALNDHPVTSKLVTIVGEVSDPVTVRVPVGMSIGDALKSAGRVTVDDPVYLIGGPMMGSFKSSADPVTKTTNAIIVLPRDHKLVQRKKTDFKIAKARAASACCQCMTCTDLCPRHNLGHPIEPHLFMRAVANGDAGNTEAFLNTMYCSSCGLCENFSCPQGLNPRSMMAEVKSELRKNGIKPVPKEPKPVNEAREYRKVPTKRLLARLGLSEYDKEARLNDAIVPANRVSIGLSQHIGAPAVPCVKVGDLVKEGDCIATPASGLSVGIHASISGRVLEINERFVIIEKE
ncbi:MAG: 4Fe-4S dicluster domain-containing protein [Lachnospiraceae bacterium]|nr:4Fe-4S dicluster domain-containing protein [Lachnospiraceae bacterium]